MLIGLVVNAFTAKWRGKSGGGIGSGLRRKSGDYSLAVDAYIVRESGLPVDGQKDTVLLFSGRKYYQALLNNNDGYRNLLGS